MTDIIRLPEGVEIDILTYLISPTTGMEVVMRVSGLPAMAPLEQHPDVRELVKGSGLGEFADDWRLMTRAEIRDYKDRDDSHD